MRMNYFKWTVLCVALASWAVAGVTIVHEGPVSGKWCSGDSVIVEGPAYVPESEELLVEGGVSIFFASASRFEAVGLLRLEGEESNPVLIYAVENWRGIRLFGPSWHVFRHVVILSDHGLPRQCVELMDGGLSLLSCNFTASENCLRVINGEIQASGNSFLTSGLYSRVVEFNYLQGFASPDCGYAPGNIFRDNFVKADVPALRPDDPVDPFATTVGVWVENSTNICLSANNITVRGPLNVIGVRFGSTPEFGDQSWDLDLSMVYAESFNQMALGVLNEVNGNLDVSKMTIAVKGAEGYTSSCFFASRTAYIRVNSTTTIMGGSTDLYFNATGTGRIDADYVVKWRDAGLTLDEMPEDPAGLIPGETFEEAEVLGVTLGDSIWDVDPQFAKVGHWGEWRNSPEVAAFFGLRSSSPCIDRGDPTQGIDPDNTRLDIGRFYFHQTQSPVDPRPGVPVTAAMAAAYPNPFNPSTSLPISVDGAGLLRVTIWDVLGRVVFDHTVPIYTPGLQNVHFDASGLSSGLYLAQAEFEGKLIGAQRLALVK